jgi:bacterioferritin-associated ferredoxin
MYVCICHGITDKAIKQAVLEDGVGNLRELKGNLGVVYKCGTCVQLAQAIIDDTIMDESLFKEVC